MTNDNTKDVNVTNKNTTRTGDEKMESSQKTQTSGLRKLGYASAVIGGGVVGADYATWMQVDPAVGAVMGSAIGTVVTKILYHLQDDPENKILDFLMRVGMVLGAVAGAYLGYKVGMVEDQDSVLVYSGSGFLGGGVLGVIAGKIVSGLISLSAFLLLFISRGPVGLFLRNALANQSNLDESSQAETTSSALFSALENIFSFIN